MPLDAADLRRLYTVPPEEFVAARNATVKELRAAKDRDTAAVVAKLRRPSVADWALNTVSAEHADELADALDAAARMHEAQAAAVEGRDGPDVRGAVLDLREHSQRVLALAEEAVSASGRPTGPQVAALTARLAEVAVNEAAAEQLRAGHLGSADVDAVDPFAGLTPAVRPTGRARRKQGQPGPPAPKPPKPPTQPKRAARQDRPDRQAAPPDEAAARRRLERAAAVARKDQGRARTALAKAEKRVVAAGDAVDSARTAMAAADQRLAAAQEEQQRAAERSAEADAALEAAEAALD